jgi:DNA repair protein RecO (recombination protein O)
MSDQSRGIVLQHIRYSESSLIVKIFTEEFGLISFLIKGAYGKHSRFKPAFFQPLSLIEFVSRIKPGRELHFMSEIAVETPFHSLHSNIQKNSIVLFISELLSKTIIESSQNKRLFDFIHQAIQWLDLQEQRFADFHLYFMIELSRHLGFYPKSDRFQNGQVFDLMEGVFKFYQPSVIHYLSDKQSIAFHQLCLTSLENLYQVQLSRELRREILDLLIVYYRLHLPGFKGLHSHEVLGVVLG